MYIQKLINFLKTVEDDPRIGTAHIAVYAALFERWCENKGEDPVSFSRPEIMKSAKIQSRATYHSCMRTLHDYGYIRYSPSHHPVLGSMVFLGEMVREGATN
jgi:hypothetical protein